MKGIFRFVLSRYFWLNLVLALVAAVGLFFLLNWWLSSYTLHGETVSVPNVRGLTESQLAEILEEKELRYQIVDSIYNPKVGKGGVVEQDPLPDMLVKVNRTIYLTMNASNPPKVKMPDLKDLSLRQAVATLETYGLKAGRSIYVPDIAYNAVLKQQVDGKEVSPGTELMKGTVVDLVLGQGVEGEPVPVPRLTGLTFREAVDALRLASFNLGSVITEGVITDTAGAIVYKQIPAYSSESYHKAGGVIDLFVSSDPGRAPAPPNDPE